MNGKSFLLGYSIISSSASNAEKIINMCNENAIPFSKIKIEEEKLSFYLPLLYERKLLRLAKNNEIELVVLSRRGLPALLFRYRMRAGIFAGLIASIILYALASSVIWDIRIDGAKNINEKALLSTFAECGLSVGAKIDELDIDVLENQILILSDDISWVSINLSNNVANVEIREIDYELPNEYGDALYSNVIASQNGIIVGFESIKGNIAVDIGDAVCKNQLLISGILGNEGAPTRLTNAHGYVFAEVEDIVEIKIPKNYVKKITKECVKSEKSLIFFKNEIKFFANSRNSLPTCDKINIVENFYTVNDKKLPIAVKTVKYIEYEEQEISRTKEEMLSLAYSELYQYINLNFNDAEILSRKVAVAEYDTELVLTCKLVSVKNIAQVKEILVD